MSNIILLVNELSDDPIAKINRDFDIGNLLKRRFILVRQLCCVSGFSAIRSRNNRNYRARLRTDHRALHSSASRQTLREKQRLDCPRVKWASAVKKLQTVLRTARRHSFLTTTQSYTFAFMFETLIIRQFILIRQLCCKPRDTLYWAQDFNPKIKLNPHVQPICDSDSDSVQPAICG